MIERVEILGVKVDAVTMAQAVKYVEDLIGECGNVIAGNSRRRIKSHFERGKLGCS